MSAPELARAIVGKGGIRRAWVRCAHLRDGSRSLEGEAVLRGVAGAATPALAPRVV